MTDRVLHRVKLPASVANIDLDRVRRALFKFDGNITRAAKALKVSSADLRRLAWRNPTLIMDALEHAHCMLDKAEENLRKALRGDHPERSLRASLFILSHSPVARERGWCRHGGDSDYFYSPPPAAALTVVWVGDMPPGYRPSLPSAPEARRAAEATSSLPVDSLEDKRVH